MIAKKKGAVRKETVVIVKLELVCGSQTESCLKKVADFPQREAVSSRSDRLCMRRPAAPMESDYKRSNRFDL